MIKPALSGLRRRVADLVSTVRGRTHLGDVTAIAADRYGDRPAIEDPAPTPGLHDGGLRTYIEIEEAVARLAAADRDLELNDGRRVLVLADNRIDLVLHALALARAGAVPVPVNPRLRSHEIAAVAAASDADVAVVDTWVAERLAEPGGNGDAPTLDLITADEMLADWVQDHPRHRLERIGRDPDDVALLLTTSGTTGAPKAAALTSAGLMSSIGLLALLPAATGPRSDRDLVLASLPLAHAMGFAVALACLCAGVPLLHRSSFDAGESLELIERRRPNVFVGVPTMYADLEYAGAAARDCSSIQIWGSSADAMPSERARRFQEYGATIRVAGRAFGTAAFADIYGMVELSGAAALRIYPPSPTGRFELPSFAIVAPGLEIRAVDEDRRPVGWGREGELEFRGTGVLRGYEGREQAGPDADGWFATGDFGRLFPGRLFQFSGRRKDRLKVGGFSVFPAEVEEELRGRSDVRELAVVGVPDDRLGERPVAVVVPGQDFDRADFLSYAEKRVAGYRRPRDVVVVDAIPRGNNDKVDRRAATELACDALEED